LRESSQPLQTSESSSFCRASLFHLFESKRCSSTSRRIASSVRIAESNESNAFPLLSVKILPGEPAESLKARASTKYRLGFVRQLAHSRSSIFCLRLGCLTSSNSPPQTGVLTFSVSQGTPPANDDFPGIEITGLPFTHTVDTTFAISDGQASLIGPTVWYNYTPDEDVELWADTLGSDYRAMIELRDFQGNPPSGVDQEYQDCEIIDQGLFYRAKAGETIYFQIGAMPLGTTGRVVFKLKQYDGSPELVCYGKMGPPYEGYGGRPRPTPTPAPVEDVTPISLPAGGAFAPSSHGWTWATIILGGALTVLASAGLLVRTRRR